jgi:hypothetical protein
MRVTEVGAARTIMVLMVDSTDHVTGKAGLTLTITASKAGGAFGSISPSVVDRGSGWYSIALTAVHTDAYGDLALHITSTGADPCDLIIQIVGYEPEDYEYLGLEALENIEAKTDNLPSDPASETSIDTLETMLVTIDDNVDSVKAKTDALPASPASEDMAYAIANIVLFVQRFLTNKKTWDDVNKEWHIRNDNDTDDMFVWKPRTKAGLDVIMSATAFAQSDKVIPI